MKNDALYWMFSHLLDATIWGGELLDVENLPEEGPAVFVSNHAEALGPIALIASLPVRVYPWIISDMMERDRAAAYLRRDFVKPQLHVPTEFLQNGLSWIISRLSVPLLHAAECIPVWQGEALLETFRISVDYLAQGRNLLVFPEDPTRPMDDLFWMRPFKKGFARLGEFYYGQTKRILRFYPVAVHPGVRKIRVGAPISYNPFNDAVRERIRLRDVLESIIHDLYLSLTLERYTSIPLPR